MVILDRMFAMTSEDQLASVKAAGQPVGRALGCNLLVANSLCGTEIVLVPNGSIGRALAVLDTGLREHRVRVLAALRRQSTASGPYSASRAGSRANNWGVTAAGVTQTGASSATVEWGCGCCAGASLRTTRTGLGANGPLTPVRHGTVDGGEEA